MITAAFSPIPDFVEDVLVVQSPVNAASGRVSGGQVKVVTKSGGNEFHGSVFTSRILRGLNAKPDSGKATTPEEMEYAFQMAKGLKVKAITTSTQVSVAEKIAPFADKHKMVVGYHGHDSENPDEFATPDSFVKAMAMSKYHSVNLDIGHFTAADFDAIAFLKEHHARITNLHIKDRKKNHGPNVPWGTGDTPIKDILLLLKKEKWDIPANIEFEYPGDAVTEVTKCLQFCKDTLK